MANVGIRAQYEAVVNKSTSSSGPIHTNQFAKFVEKKLYSYPIWKISYKYRQYLDDDSLCEKEIGISLHDYVIYVKLIEETLTALSPTQRKFVQRRYFERTPFKIIAEEMAMAERHLYRIRQEVIQIFVMSFGGAL